MSIYPNLTEEDFINSFMLSGGQNIQRAIKIKNKNSKKTHDEEIANAFSPITRKLVEVFKSTEKNEKNLKPQILKLQNLLYQFYKLFKVKPQHLYLLLMN